MRRFNIYWIIVIVAITVITFWQVLSITKLYQFEKEKFSSVVADAMYLSVYDLNTSLPPDTRGIVSINPLTFELIILQEGKKKRIHIDKNIEIVEAEKRATYDIRDPKLWTLERLDSLFQEQTKSVSLLFPISYQLQDSTGKTIQNYTRGKLSPSPIKGRTIILGFLTKHSLNFKFEYPIKMFIHSSTDALILIIGLFFLLISSLLLLIQIIRKEKKQAERQELAIHSIVHNLRAPVNNVISARHYLKEEMEENMNKYEAHLIEVMQGQLLQATNTITRLLNLNRAFQTIKINRQTINLPEFTQNVVKKDSMIAPRKKKIEFLIKLEMQNPLIEADPTHLTEIMQNLIDNSIKYSGKEVQIAITCEESEKLITIHFSDNGDGIKKEARKNVFKPYYRCTEASRGKKGYGLGLYYVKSAINAHGGTISINEKKEKGTEFIIILPRK